MSPNHNTTTEGTEPQVRPHRLCCLITINTYGDLMLLTYWSDGSGTLETI